MKKSIYFILIVVILFCVFYGIRYVENPVETQTAISEVYENKIDTKGYIVRTEQVYNAPVSGTVYHYIKEGTRVGKGRVLSTVYTGDVSESTLQELNSINQKIAELENEGEATSYMAGGNNSEEDIENIKNNIISAKRNQKIEKIANYKAQINAIITGDSKSAGTVSLDELLAKKSSIEASLRSSKNDLYSQISGVFSKNVDSLEDVLTPKNILTYKLADYESLSDKAKEYKSTTNPGQPVCKVVNNHEWYVMTTVKKEEAQELKIGKKVKMRFGYLPGVTANGKIEYMSQEDSKEDRIVVVIKFEEYREGVFSLRYSDMELILESYEGYRIPVSALRVTEDGKKGVLVKSVGSQIIKPVNVVYSDIVRETVIITPVSGSKNLLREYDSIVIGEK